ncbi:MAG TPA: hypothetical protein ENH20_01320 [Candidatus Pacearchaeota archaeon]|nr:hypothetical protein [Candidatus Pacearchaeota archaeon]
MVFFNKSLMNGATLFGVCITLAALGFLDDFDIKVKIFLFGAALVYGTGSMVAFIFFKLSEK